MAALVPDVLFYILALWFLRYLDLEDVLGPDFGAGTW